MTDTPVTTSTSHWPSLASALSQALGDNLVSLTLYGSLARGTAASGSADANVLIVLNDIELPTLASLRKVFDGIAPRRITPYLVTRREWPHVVEAFPTRILEMKRGYQVLHGIDLLAAVQIDNAVLAIRARQELLNMLLRFRHLLLGSEEVDALERDLRVFLQPYFKTLRSLIYLRTGKHIESRKELTDVAAKELGISREPLLQLSAWRSGKVAFAGEEWNQAAGCFFTILQQTAAAIDG